ncbi:MAG: hypothetical protein D9V44_01315 [Actinobacteria bacterium]|nr:MAG: hypothetical protein D9V44_01315 [Actinomycetota bacterium]
MLSLAATIIAVTNAGLGVAIAVGARGRRAFRLLFGLQAVASLFGVWIVSSAGVSQAWWSVVTGSASAFLVCFVGPSGLIVALAARVVLAKVATVRVPEPPA